MRPLFESITDFHRQRDTIRARRHGVIEVADGRFKAIHFRPWPKLISLGEVWWESTFARRGDRRDRCQLFYDQPARFPNFLAVKYVVSGWGATFRTVRGAAVILDEVARVKGIDALVCEAWNLRISDRLLHRWGWERHVHHSRRRHHIKRFYGVYPENDDLAAFLAAPETQTEVTSEPALQATE